MATDNELFATYYFPHYCEMAFNAFHLDYFDRVVFGERKVRRVGIAPRGSAKSTLATLIKPIHDVCYGLENFILFVSATEPLANAKLKDIRAEVLSNTALQADFGISFATKKVAESEFTVISDYGVCHYRAAGKGSQVRGIRYKQHRPSKLVFDDFEVSDEVNNDALRKKTEDVFHQEFGKTGNQFTNIEFVGTVLHKDALTITLSKNPRYDTRIYRAVISWAENQDLWNQWRKIYHNIGNDNRLAEARAFYEAHEAEMLRGTKVLWPEKYSYYDLMAEQEEIGRRSFMKEMQNDPVGSDEPVFENILWYQETNEGLLIEHTGELIKYESIRHTACGAIDPSTGAVKAKKGKLGDFSVLLTGLQEPKGRVLVHHDITKRISPTKQIQEIFNCHERFNYQKFAVETNLYRDLLLPNIIEERKRREAEQKKIIKIAFYDVLQTENKHQRIHRLEPKVNHGWILFNRNLSQDFMRMMEDYPHHDNDDGPDCLEMLWNTFHNVYKASAVSINIMNR